KHRPRNEQWPGLVIEMPEAQLLNKVVPVRDRFQELRKYGVSLASDNFGRGNSSFAASRYLRFAQLKLDPACVPNCAATHGTARRQGRLTTTSTTIAQRHEPHPRPPSRCMPAFSHPMPHPHGMAIVNGCACDR